MDKDTVFFIISALLGLLGAALSFMMKRMMKSMDDLVKEDQALHEKLRQHREDMIANYVRHEQLSEIKKDIIGRVDRMETSITNTLNNILGNVIKGLRQDKEE